MLFTALVGASLMLTLTRVARTVKSTSSCAYSFAFSVDLDGHTLVNKVCFQSELHRLLEE